MALRKDLYLNVVTKLHEEIEGIKTKCANVKSRLFSLFAKRQECLLQTMGYFTPINVPIGKCWKEYGKKRSQMKPMNHQNDK